MNPTDRRWFEYGHVVTFGDTNTAGSVYFARYFHWQGECRERLLAEFYPEFPGELRQGFSLITEFAHLDFFHEATLFERVTVRLTVTSLSRSRIEFEFEFVREPDRQLLARGAQAVIWTNPQRHPSLMPDRLFDATTAFFNIQET